MLINPHAHFFLLSRWLQTPPARITFYPVRVDSNTDAELPLLVSSLFSEFCKTSLCPINSALFVPTVSGTSFFPSFVNLPLGHWTVLLYTVQVPGIHRALFGGTLETVGGCRVHLSRNLGCSFFGDRSVSCCFSHSLSQRGCIEQVVLTRFCRCQAWN